jgi:putative membrane protein
MHDRSWTFEPAVVLWLTAFAAIYIGGLFRLWSTAGAGKGISRAQAAAFAGGWLTLVAALMSPLDRISDWLFSAHMIQHELLMVVAAPLVAASSPLVAATWIVRRRVQIPWRLHRPVMILATAPAFVWGLHAIVLWVWHLPVLFEGAMAHESIHVFQHFSFFMSACLFWWGLAHGRYGRLGYGAAVLYLFATGLHSGILGALLTFSPEIWYPVYASTTAAWGFTPIEDQQLAGLVMWIPASLVFLVGGLIFFAGWLRESGRRDIKDLGLPRMRPAKFLGHPSSSASTDHGGDA